MIAAPTLTVMTLEALTLSRGERVLFRGLTARVEAGRALSLTGANGAGKTSLLRAVAGLIRPDAGVVGFGDVDPAEARANHIHLLGHLDGLKGGRTARDELDFQARYLGAATAAITDAVARLRLTPLLDLEVRQLSAGQRRRLAFARLVAARRSLWLLDEPFAPLDAEWRAAVGRAMQAHLDDGGLIVAAVHDPLPIRSDALTLGAAS